MRFMLIRKADAETEAGILPSTELLAAMGEYIGGLAKSGVLLSGDGLQASSKGARVKFRGGKPTVTDGPFTETKELVAGYCIIEAPSLAAAIDVARQWPGIDGNGEVELEIRPFHSAEDFGEAMTPELRAEEERMRAELASRGKA
jgi:hypothetical protein